MGKKKSSKSSPSVPSSAPITTGSGLVIPTSAPTPEEIGKQYEAQLNLLQQQQQQYAAQFESAFQSLQGEYGNSISLLNKQWTEREATNNSLLDLMKQQVQAAQVAQVENQQKYDSLLSEQRKQVSLLDVLQQRANANLESEQTEGLQTAMQKQALNSRRKLVDSQQRSKQVNPGAYKSTLLTKSTPVTLQSLLR